MAQRDATQSSSLLKLLSDWKFQEHVKLVPESSRLKPKLGIIIDSELMTNLIKSVNL